MASAEAIKILKEYRSQLLSFLDELIEQFPDQGDLIIAKLYIQNQVEIKVVVENFIIVLSKDDNKMKKSILNQEDSFFLENRLSEFLNVNSKYTSNFKKIWQSNRLDQEDKQAMWNWVKVFVMLVDRYEAVNKNN